MGDKRSRRLSNHTVPLTRAERSKCSRALCGTALLAAFGRGPTEIAARVGAWLPAIDSRKWPISVSMEQDAFTPSLSLPLWRALRPPPSRAGRGSSRVLRHTDCCTRGRVALEVSLPGAEASARAELTLAVRADGRFPGNAFTANASRNSSPRCVFWEERRQGEIGEAQHQC